MYGPIVCEITTKNANAATYLEQHVAQHVWQSFVVESKEDYNLLYREVREKRGLKINIIIIEGGELKQIRRKYTESMMETLKRDHGVMGYLDEFFEAPAAVMQALIESSNVQSVLVGSDKTQESLDKRGLLKMLTSSEDGSGTERDCCIFSTNMNKAFKVRSTIDASFIQHEESD